MTTTLNAVSYNVHSSIGRDRRMEPERIVDVIRSAGASIIGLQEVDARIGGERRLDQFRYFAEAAGMRSIAGPNIVDHRGQYGNALLTSWPIEESRLIRLGVPGREPRGAIIAVLRCGEFRLQVVNTHLGLRPSERRQQVVRLIKESAPFDSATLFMGDFNVWTRRSLLLGGLGAPLDAGLTPRTFPARRPLVALDRIWVRPPAAMRSVRALRTELTAVASDHLPLIATFELM